MGAAALHAKEASLGSDRRAYTGIRNVSFRMDSHAKCSTTIQGKTITDFKTNIDLI